MRSKVSRRYRNGRDYAAVFSFAFEGSVEPEPSFRVTELLRHGGGGAIGSSPVRACFSATRRVFGEKRRMVNGTQQVGMDFGMDVGSESREKCVSTIPSLTRPRRRRIWAVGGGETN